MKNEDIEPASPTSLTQEQRRIVEQRAAEGIPRATLRARRADLTAFSEWCAERKLSALPAEPHTVAAYLQSMADSGFAWATIARRLSTIAQAHKSMGVSSPSTSFLVQQACVAIKRDITIAQTKARPITLVDLARWLPLLPDDPRGVRDAAMLMMGFAGALRRSEIASLLFGDIEKGDRGLLVTIRKSKTDQFGQGVLVGIERGQSATTCPVTRWAAWCALRDGAGVCPESSAFLSVRGNALTDQPISGATVNRAVKRLAQLGGANPEEYSAHSLRAGLITEATRARVPYDAIMKHTRHKSYEVFLGYVRRETLWEQNPTGLIGL